MTGKHDELVARPADVWADLEAKGAIERLAALTASWTVETATKASAVQLFRVADVLDALKLIEAARRSTESPDQPNGAE